MKLKIFLASALIFQNALAWAGPAIAEKKTEPAVAAKAAEPSIETPIAKDDSENCECYMKWHKRFSYLTMALAAGAVATHEEKQEAEDSHKTLGMATAASFFTASYFAWKMPMAEGMKESNSQKYHRWLGYTLVPMMILLPAAGMDADKDYKDGHSPDGIGEMKGALSGLTFATLIASTVTLAFEF